MYKVTRSPFVALSKGAFAAALLSATLAATTVQAAPPPAELRYDFIDIGANFGEVDDTDFSGIGVAGSWGFHPNIALFGSLGTGEIDAFGDVDTKELTIGINPHFALTERIDLVIPIALEYADFDTAFGGDDDTGYSIGVGARFLPTPAWEFGLGIQHVDIFSSTDQNLFGSARWHINQLFSLGLGGSFGDDVSSAQLDVRFSF
ncbi:MAG: outer membrane beta-barrel protein [Pseudomonadota bacterium]